MEEERRIWRIVRKTEREIADYKLKSTNLKENEKKKMNKEKDEQENETKERKMFKILSKKKNTK